ncbi:hypothetical protein GIB67_002937 [Kingdonia uniflora]|uniref:Retrotransposon gag domain-containing protein n=1 Tax=Kingdonia uniflora TaxID=39325 RepID=A0A7J7M911_9MAGN|nr:hypothetical protein GIB67_002937 [Kingdonia uniflora]
MRPHDTFTTVIKFWKDISTIPPVRDAVEAAQYDWGSAILASLYHGLDTAVTTGGVITRFSQLFEYWFYEYCGVGHLIVKEEVKFSAYPCFRAWERGNMMKTNDQATNLFILRIYHIDHHTIEMITWEPWLESEVSKIDDVLITKLLSRKRIPLQVPNRNCKYYLGDRCWRQLTGETRISLYPLLSMLPHIRPGALHEMRQAGFLDYSQRMGNIDMFGPTVLKDGITSEVVTSASVYNLSQDFSLPDEPKRPDPGWHMEWTGRQSVWDAQRLQQLTNELAIAHRHIDSIDEQLYSYGLHLRRERDVRVVQGRGSVDLVHEPGEAVLAAAGDRILKMILNKYKMVFERVCVMFPGEELSDVLLATFHGIFPAWFNPSSLSLKGEPLRWFHTLDEGSIVTFEQFRELLIKNYLHNKDKEESLYSLFNLKQAPREKLETFTQNFFGLAWKLDNLDKKITISAFTNALLIDGRVKEHLILDKPQMLEDMTEKVNNFIDLKRLTTEKQKPQRTALSTNDHTGERTHNNSKDYGGDKKRFKSYDDQTREGKKRPVPRLPRLTTTIANIYPLLQKDELFKNANTLQPIPGRPYCIHHKIHHHDTEQCFVLKLLLLSIFSHGRMLEYIVDVKSYEDGSYKIGITVVQTDEANEEKYIYLIETQTVSHSNRSKLRRIEQCHDLTMVDKEARLLPESSSR